MCLEQLTVTMKEMSLGCLSAELMGAKMVLLMERDWVVLTEIKWDQLTGKKRSLVRLLAE